MSNKIEIEKDVPLPTKSDVPALPLEAMKPGDSFVVAAATDAERAVVRQRCHRYTMKTEGKPKFSIRTLDDERVRVFRLEE